MKNSINATRRSGYQAILLALLASSLFHTASAAQKIYFQLDGTDIASDNVPEDWEGWMTGRAFGQGYERRATGAARAVPKIASEFQIVKHLDKSSPKLAQALLEGRVFPRLTVVYLHEGIVGSEPVQVILENVSVVSHHISGGKLDRVQPTEKLGALLTEEIGFAFETAQFLYGDVSPEAPEAPGTKSDPNLDTQDEDSDRDGLPDSYERAHGLNLQAADDQADTDGDGLTNGEEFAAGSAPNDRHSRFGIDHITLMKDKPGRGLVSFRALPGRQYRLLGSPTGQTWFELDAFTVPADGEAVQQEIELSFNGLTQLLRVEVTINR